MKKVLLFILLFATFALTGCSKTRITNLVGDELFAYEDGSYLVYVYKDNCEACEDVTPIVESYVRAYRDGAFENKSPIYGFNLSNKTNSVVDREYDSEAGDLDGQGKEGNLLINDITNWDELYIGNAPLLIVIRNRTGNRIAEFWAEGADINSRLQSYYYG